VHRGAFDSESKEKNLPRTPYDAIIDETSNKPGEQAFEKMVAGLYLGELFRLVMCELIDDGVLFLGQETYKVEKPCVSFFPFLPYFLIFLPALPFRLEGD
jgi:hexokinase